jgi:hypothetical protein
MAQQDDGAIPFNVEGPAFLFVLIAISFDEKGHAPRVREFSDPTPCLSAKDTPQQSGSGALRRPFK